MMLGRSRGLIDEDVCNSTVQDGLRGTVGGPGCKL